MFEKFTNRARMVMAIGSQRFACEMKSEFVGTEHVLLAVAEQTCGVGAKILKRMGISLKDVRRAVDRLASQPPLPSIGACNPPYTPRVKRVLELAAEEAYRTTSTWIDTSHLLLGLYKEEDGIAAQVLKTFETSHGVNLDRLRAEADAILSSAAAADEPDSEEALHQARGRNIVVVLYREFPDNTTGFPVLVVNGVHYTAFGKVTLSGVQRDKVYGAAAAIAKEHQATAYRIFEGADGE